MFFFKTNTYMKINKLLLTLTLCAPIGMAAQQPVLNPTPVRTEASGKTFALPASFCLRDTAGAPAHALRQLCSLLEGRTAPGEGPEVRIGKRGDKAVKAYASRIPDQAEGYYLELNERRIVLAGNDDRGTFYAVQTLRQLLRDEADNLRPTLSDISITDYPALGVRGIVEGFYGTPWSQQARVSQISFYGRNKLNTYIFGPKNDPYHSTPHWRKPYPEKQAEEIRSLVRHAHENEVDFVWAVHPGRDIHWNDSDRVNVKQKFEAMYNLGVRSFAVFFDDIAGNGTNAARQAELLNYLNTEFVARKGDVKPLIMCPTEYNRSRWKPQTGYMTTLGTQLDPSIHIMWTGDRALSDITALNLAWVQDIIHRKPYIWWNFPVTDFAPSRLLMGPVYGVDKGIGTETAAFVANPMQYAEASKIALYSVADLTWNPAAYDAARAWQQSIRAALPDAAEALACFCANSSDTGEGHFSRNESEYLQPIFESIESEYLQAGRYDRVAFNGLKAAFSQMVQASQDLLLSRSNGPLVSEIRPWLVHFGLIGQMGEQTVAMAAALEQHDNRAFETAYRRVAALQAEVAEMRRRTVVGGTHVMPFVRRLFAVTVRRYNDRTGSAWPESVWPR